MPHQGVTSMFSFGQSYGFILGVLTAFGIGYQLVPPGTWKREHGLLHTQKQDSVAVAKRLFPGVSLLPTERCRKESDGMAEALLIAEYARRHF
jgi:crossover junction endodeoxyribonuclease RuvC